MFIDIEGSTPDSSIFISLFCRTLLHQSIGNLNVEFNNEAMYIDNENFDKWMERLSKKLSEIGQDLKSLIDTDNVLDEMIRYSTIRI